LSFPAEGGCERRAVRPAHAPNLSMRARRSGGNRSGRRIRRSGGSGAGSVRSKETKSFDCASSRDFLPRRRQSNRRRGKKRKRKATGGRPLLRGGSLRPLTESRGGGGGASAWAGRGSARRRAVYGTGEGPIRRTREGGVNGSR
jgi:hypothetical protein